MRTQAGQGAYRRVVLDESAHAANLEDTFQNCIRATLTDLVGDCDFYSTPRGRGFFYRCYCRGQDPEQKDWASFRFPTSDNPHLPPAEVEDARRQLPDRVFRQEYLAEFMDDAGGVFRNVQACVDVGRTPEVEAQTQQTNEHFGGQYGERSGVTYGMGLDLARIHDFSVCTVLDSNGRQVYFDRWGGQSWDRQVSGIVNIAERFRPFIYADSTGIGQPVVERLERMGLSIVPYSFSNASKTQLMDNLAGMIEQGKIRLMDIPVQTGELINYEYKLTAARNVTMQAPEGEFDDCVCALALGAWAHNQPKWDWGSAW